MRTGTATSRMRLGVRSMRWMSGSTPVSLAASSRRSSIASHGPDPGITSIVVALHGRRRDPRPVIDEQVADDVGHPFGGRAWGEVDRHHVGVDVHVLDTAVVEEAASQLV